MSSPEPSLLATLTPAIFGLVGVLLGSASATLKEWWFSRRNDKRDARYLAVQVVGQLDRYAFACSEVVNGQRSLQRAERRARLPPSPDSDTHVQPGLVDGRVAIYSSGVDVRNSRPTVQG